jgi:UDP-N-acetylglucosamine 3-dehydrogenase
LDGVSVAVIGAGYIGRVHVRVLNRIAREHGLVGDLYVSDVDRERAKSVARTYGATPVGPPQELPQGVEFAVVAVPTTLHRIVVEELVTSKGVGGILVEKPLAHNPSDSASIVRLHKEGRAWIATGHVERFNPAAVALASWVARGRLGDLLASSARRIGPFAPRAGGVDVILDLGVHEVDMAFSLKAEEPEFIRGYTLAGVASELNDYAIVVMGFEGSYATMELSRITPYKQRVLTLTGTQAAASLDYMAQDARVYTAEYEASLKIRKEEPIYLEDLATLSAYIKGMDPPVDAYQGHVAVEVCEAARRSALGGESVKLKGSIRWVEEALKGYRRYREAIASRGLEGLLG